MKNKVLYLTYTGMTEALGASQVLSYLSVLSEKYDIFLISLEHNGDFHDKEKMNSVAVQMNRSNIHWYPYEYKNGAKGYLSNFMTMFKRSKKIIKQENIFLVHCRSYMPTIVAYCLKSLNHKINYIFDTRGFWFDEKADVGDWSRKGLPYKFSKIIEKRLYLAAFHIVMLSKNGKDTINNGVLFKGGELLNNITVIPTCVNLNRFYKKNRDIKQPYTVCYSGTAIGWYDFDLSAHLLSILHKKFDCKVFIFNGGQHAYINEVMSKYGMSQNDDYFMEKVPFEEMPKRLEDIDFSVFFLKECFSKRASAATKIGELFACGIPVITNSGIGDHEWYINSFNTGFILNPSEMDTYDYNLILEKILTNQTSSNCRKLAETYFSLEEGVKKYMNIYSSFFDGSSL